MDMSAGLRMALITYLKNFVNTMGAGAQPNGRPIAI
jgi:hypothetical protein